MQDFLRALHEAGPFAYLWSRKQTLCFPVGGELPTLSPTDDVYFGVNPVRDWLPSGRRGGVANVSAMHCVYADFDGKDFVPLAGVDLAPYEKRVRDTNPKLSSPAMIENMAIKEYQKEQFRLDRQRFLKLLARKLEILPLPPSYLVYTGGGAHCYWLLSNPYRFQSQDDQAEAKSLLVAWVKLIGADPAAASMDRVLRLPDTYNNKYNPPVLVRIRQTNDVRYSTQELQEVIDELSPPDFATPIPNVSPAQRAPQTAPVVRDFPKDEKPIWEYFNERYTVTDILLRNGYEQRRDGRYARPNGATDSVTVFGDKISYHHSSSDPLFWGNFNGHGHDAFRLFVQLEHNGDMRAAAKAAREALGLTSAHFSSRGPRASVKTYGPDDVPADPHDYEVDDRDFANMFGAPIAVDQRKNIEYLRDDQL